MVSLSLRLLNWTWTWGAFSNYLFSTTLAQTENYNSFRGKEPIIWWSIMRCFLWCRIRLVAVSFDILGCLFCKSWWVYYPCRNLSWFDTDINLNNAYLSQEEWTVIHRSIWQYLISSIFQGAWWTHWEIQDERLGSSKWDCGWSQEHMMNLYMRGSSLVL